jgi:hypothetical protein
VAWRGDTARKLLRNKTGIQARIRRIVRLQNHHPHQDFFIMAAARSGLAQRETRMAANAAILPFPRAAVCAHQAWRFRFTTAASLANVISVAAAIVETRMNKTQMGNDSSGRLTQFSKQRTNSKVAMMFLVATERSPIIVTAASQYRSEMLPQAANRS